MTRRAGGVAYVRSLVSSFCNYAYVGSGAVVVDEVAGHLVSTFSDHALLGYDCPACVDRDRAPGVKAAPGRRVDGGREIVAEQYGLARPLLGRIGYGRRRQQRLGVGVRGGAEDAGPWALLDQLAQVHHSDLVGEVLDG